ncbi:MAG: DEAD/DEAH box helicase [Firmicutes bacterium]|nr:DEAD/DEAH box helicase [Bacillota bacterium]MCL5039288.1 DEAD/DEAH box helicase [Bacillota bacterium]
MRDHHANPVIVQSDRTILLEVQNPRFAEGQAALVRFAELVKSPEHVHTYRITPLSLWNAASSGLGSGEILATLQALSRYPVPDNVQADIKDYSSRYGRLKLFREGEALLLRSEDPYLILEILNQKALEPYILSRADSQTLAVSPWHRGRLKQALVKLGWPVQDLAGYTPGTPLSISLREQTPRGVPFRLRPYQEEALIAFRDQGTNGGSGVIALPCGSGKTIIGLGLMAQLQTETLILSTNIIAVRQWIDEILDKTNLTREQVGEYSGEVKEIKPVTVTTYQILTHRGSKEEDFPHFSLFNQKNWGLIIYDEVHLLPAPVFRITAEIQSKQRLGLTATLVREDGREDDVFTLIGPKKYDAPWKVLEKEAWIATAVCYEIRVNLDPRLRLEYAVAGERSKFRIASENPGKLPIIQALVEKHADEQVLVIGQYLDQLQQVARMLGAPLITGKVSNREREELYRRFKSGDLRRLVVSKVANFAVDLPDASVAIQISGTFGSRQEEAQRLGRILRPKSYGTLASFYSIVTRDTKDQTFAANRQLFLTEQGYRYTILDSSQVQTVFADAAESPGR